MVGSDGTTTRVAHVRRRVRVYSVDEIFRVHNEPLVGGGGLEVERHGAATVTIPYTLTLSDKFSEVACGLEQLRSAGRR